MSCHQPFHPSPTTQPIRSQWSPLTGNAPATTTLSRKRSRVDDDELSVAPNSTFIGGLNPSLESKPELVYGEGMTLVDSSNGLAISAESQTGTWYEEQLDVERLAASQAVGPAARFLAGDRSLPRCKLQRRSPSSDTVVREQTMPFNHVKDPEDSYVEPALDSISQSFGEWACVSDDHLVRLASRGWAKFVERYHPSLNNVEVLLRFKLRNQCLIRANEGFFLFKEDLREGQLVAQTWEAAVANLKTEPPVFEGTEVLMAEKSPASSEGSSIGERSSDSSLPDTNSYVGSGMDID
ncbi:MAG: hypothetical protein Q9187_001254 [Circinaria calcarea]